VHKLEYHVPEKYSKARPSFAYNHVNHLDTSISKHPEGSKLHGGYTGDTPAVMYNPIEVQSLVGADSGPRGLADYVEHDRGQLGLHIVSFSDATLVTMNWLHSLWDAMGRSEFLRAWIAILDGRDNDVRPFHGFNTDPLKELGLHPQETYELADRVLSIPQLIIFGLRRTWEQLMHKEEGRILCIPSAFIQKLREEAIPEAKQAASSDSGSRSQDVFLSDGDLMFSWLGRSIVRHSPIRHGRTVAFFNAFGMRGVLEKEGMLPNDAAYVANCVTSVYTLIPAGDVANRPIGYVASKLRQTLKVQGTREQLEASIALVQKSFAKTGYPAIFGDATMQMIVVSNWSKAKFFEMDFSAAIVDSPSSSNEHSKTRGKPSYIQPIAYSDYSKRFAFNVSGKDNDGNYWLTGVLRKAAWDRFDKALKGGEV